MASGEWRRIRGKFRGKFLWNFDRRKGNLVRVIRIRVIEVLMYKTSGPGLYFGYHTCWLSYFILVCLWCGRTAGGRAYGHVITKMPWMRRLPNFLPNSAPLCPLRTRRGAPLLCTTEKIRYCYFFFIYDTTPLFCLSKQCIVLLIYLCFQRLFSLHVILWHKRLDTLLNRKHPLLRWYFLGQKRILTLKIQKLTTVTKTMKKTNTWRGHTRASNLT